MTTLPLVSIIIPCYNVAKYISNTLDSLQKQTYKNIEIIIVDDASDDGTVQILEKYCCEPHLNIVFETVNKGVSATRNIGMSMAKGRYLAFLDADDKYDVDFIKEGIDKINYSKAQVYCCSFMKEGLIHKDYSIGVKYSEKVFSGHEFLMLLFNKKIYQHICAMIIDTVLISDMKLKFDGRLSYSEDLLFIVMMLACVEKIYYSNTPRFKYNIRNNSAMNAMFKPKRKDSLFALNIMSDVIYHSSSENVRDVYPFFTVYAGITRLYLLRLAIISGCGRKLLVDIFRFNLPKINFTSIVGYNRKYLFIALISYFVEVFKVREK